MHSKRKRRLLIPSTVELKRKRPFNRRAQLPTSSEHEADKFRWQSIESIFIAGLPEGLDESLELEKFLKRMLSNLPHRRGRQQCFAKEPILKCRLVARSRIAFLTMHSKQEVYDMLKLDQYVFKKSRITVQPVRGMEDSLGRNKNKHSSNRAGDEESTVDGSDDDNCSVETSGDGESTVGENEVDKSDHQPWSSKYTIFISNLPEDYGDERKLTSFLEKNKSDRGKPNKESILGCRFTERGNAALVKVRSPQDTLDLLHLNKICFGGNPIFVKLAYKIKLADVKSLVNSEQPFKSTEDGSKMLCEGGLGSNSNLFSNQSAGARDSYESNRNFELHDENRGPSENTDSASPNPGCSAPTGESTMGSSKPTKDEFNRLARENALLREKISQFCGKVHEGESIHGVLAQKQEIIEEKTEQKVKVVNKLLLLKAEHEREFAGNDRQSSTNDDPEPNTLAAELQRRLGQIEKNREEERADADNKLSLANETIRCLRLELKQERENHERDLSYLSTTGTKSPSDDSVEQNDQNMECIDLTIDDEDEMVSNVGSGATSLRGVVALLTKKLSAAREELLSSKSCLGSVRNDLKTLQTKYDSQSGKLAVALSDIERAEAEVQSRSHVNRDRHEHNKSNDSEQVTELRRELIKRDEIYRDITSSLALQTTELTNERRARRAVEDELDAERRRRRDAEDQLSRLGRNQRTQHRSGYNAALR